MRPMLSSIGCKFLSCYPPKRSPCPKTGRVFCCVVWGGGRHCEPLGRSNPVGLVCWPRLADLIDAPWDGSGNVAGDGASGGYTAVVSYTYESGSSDLTAAIQVRLCSYLTQVFAMVPPALSRITACVVIPGPPSSAIPHRPGILPSTVATPAAYWMPISSMQNLFVVFVPDIYR